MSGKHVSNSCEDPCVDNNNAVEELAIKKEELTEQSVDFQVKNEEEDCQLKPFACVSDEKEIAFCDEEECEVKPFETLFLSHEKETNCSDAANAVDPLTIEYEEARGKKKKVNRYTGNMDKRNRSINWESGEKELLIELMGSFQVLELKRNDTSTNKAKDKAWIELTTRFNELNKIKRNVKQLKGQWKTLKIKSHKNLSSFRKSLRETCGGPAPQPLSQETLKVLHVLPLQFASGTNEFDSDGNFGASCSRTEISATSNIEIAAVSPVTATAATTTTTTTTIPTTTTPAATATPTNSTAPITTSTATATTASIPPAAASTATPRRMYTNTSCRGSRRTFHSEESDIRYNTFRAMEKYRSLQNERQQKEHELNILYKTLENQRLQREHELRMQILEQYQKLMNIMQENLKKRNT